MKCGGKPGGGNDARRKSLRDSHIPTARLLLYILKTYFRKESSSPPAPFPFRLILGLEKTLRSAAAAAAAAARGWVPHNKRAVISDRP